MVRIIGKLPPPIGGVTISTLRLFQRLKEYEDIDVTLTVLNDYVTEDKAIEKVSNLYFWMLKRIFVGFSETFIHYQGADIKGLLFLGLVCKLHRKNKLIWSIHSEYLIPEVEKLKYKKQIFSVLKSVKVIADNKNIQKQLKNNNILSEVIFPFLMPLNFKVDKDEGIKSDKPVLLFNAYKIVFNTEGEDVYGLNTLLKAFALLREECLLVLLIPVLETREKQYLDKLLSETNLKMNKNIKIISDEKANGLNWIANSDVFIRPTITDGDALSLREALYLGTPAIASDCVQRPENTILFINKDFADLSKKITETIRNIDNLRNKLKANKYDAFDRFVELYNKLKI